MLYKSEVKIMELKRVVSVLLSTVIAGSAISVSAWSPMEGNWEAADNDGVSGRFFIGSDVHISNSNAPEKFENALNVFNTIDPDADALLLVGDVTNSGGENEYNTLMSKINSSNFANTEDETKTIIAMGNHEFGSTIERFEQMTKQDNNAAYYYYRNDDPEQGLIATVIELGDKNYGGDYTDSYDFFKAELEKANTTNPEAPIIVMGHHGIKDTAYVTNEWYGNYGKGTDKDMVALMEQYPQVIHFSGHSHATLEDARSIYQDDGYTAIQTSTLSGYFENESGTVDPATGSAITIPADSAEASQGLRLDVMEDGTVRIYRIDFTDSEYMYVGEPWVFDANDTSDRPYTSDRTSSNAPVFPAEAAVTSSNETKNSVDINFPAATAGSDLNNDMICRYRVSLTEKGTENTKTVEVFSDFYKHESRRRADWSVKVAGLKANTEYDVSVYALTSFGAVSEAITGTAATIEDVYVTPIANILDVDFSKDKTGEDAAGHELKVYGDPQLKYDDTLNRNVMVFDGTNDGLRYAMSEDIYAGIASNMTVELYYKPLDNKNNDPMGSTQVAGFCLEQDGGTNDLKAWVHVGGSYKKAGATVKQDEWNHVLFTFDGEALKFYLNGVETQSTPASGSMKIVDPQYLFLGGDMSSGGDLEYPANCEIALAKIYTGAMNAEDAKKAYDEAVKVEEPQQDMVKVSVNGPARVNNGDAASYTFAIDSKPEELKTMHLNFNISGSEKGIFTERGLEALNNSTLLANKETAEADGSITYDAVLAYLPQEETQAVSEVMEVLRLYVRTSSEKTGDINIKLNSVIVNSEVAGVVDSSASNVKTQVSNIYDINNDGSLTIDDITAVQSYYRVTNEDENWNTAKECDFNGDGVIDLEDLVEIANAYLQTV